MADSDDELIGYGDETVRRATAPRATSRAAQSRPGPSRPRAKAGAYAREVEEINGLIDGTGNEDEDDMEMDDAEEEDDVEEMPAPRGKGKANKSKAATTTSTSAANAATRTRAKGKAPVFVAEEGSDEEVVSIDEPVKKGRGRPAKAKPAAASVRGVDTIPAPSVPAAPMKTQSKVEQELKRRNAELMKQRDTYAEQFDDYVRLRTTEQEAMLEEYKTVAEERAKAQQDLIDHLQTELDQFHALQRAGQALPPALFANPVEDRRRDAQRAEREAEQRKWEQREREWQAKEDTYKKEAAQKDAYISELRDDLSNSRPILSNVTNAVSGFEGRAGVPPSTPVSKRLPASDKTKNAHIITLYEDLTNLVVYNVREEKGQYGEVIKFICALSYHGKSLQFTLTTSRDLKRPDEPDYDPKDPWIYRVVYTPTDLDKEPDRLWVSKLDFLGQTFTFNRQQMNIFLASTHNKMDARDEEESVEKEEEEDDEDV